MSENKIDIKKLMRENNIPMPEREVETNPVEIVGNLPEGFDRSVIENASSDLGVVVENQEILKNSPIKGGGISGGVISAEQMEAIEETLKEIDEEAEKARKEFDEWNKKQALEKLENGEVKGGLVVEDDDDSDEIIIVDDKRSESLVDNDVDRDTFNKKYNEAVVVIDKMGMGQVINFTDEERSKLEKVKKIKLEEVQTINLETIKTKKVKQGSSDKILKKINSIRTTNIVLPISGFTAVMKGCSTFELMGLIQGSENNVMSLVSKWTLIHSKIESTSIGNMDFNKFLNSVSQMEYDIFVYGILCATFPDEDEFPLQCPKCKTDINHKYLIRTLLRAEEMSDRLKDTIREVVDASYTIEKAKECFESSLLNTEETIKLPESEYLVTIGVQTAYSFIYDSVEAIEKLDKKYSQATILASAVDKVLTPDPEDVGSYYEMDGTEDKIKMIFALGNLDISILGAKISKLVEGMQYEFGLMDINCGNQKCKNHVNTIPVDMDSILFHKHQQAMNTTID